MVNAENARTLIELVERSDKFSMCDHSTCFIGLVAHHLGERVVDEGGKFNSRDLVAWLGMPNTNEVRVSLYLAWQPQDDRGFPGPALEDVTKERAIHMLNNLAETGSVDWYAPGYPAN